MPSLIEYLQATAPALATDLTRERLAMAGQIARMYEAARDLDELLLRFAFDAGALGDEKVSELGVDLWGVLRDFREAFGLEPTMSPEEWTRRQTAELEESDERA